MIARMGICMNHEAGLISEILATHRTNVLVIHHFHMIPTPVSSQAIFPPKKTIADVALIKHFFTNVIHKRYKN